MEILKVEKLKFSYPNQEKKTLDNINISIKDGEFVLITGESGSGKTTFLRHLKKEIAPFGSKDGIIFYKSKNIEAYSDRELSRDIGYVMQNPDAQIVTDKVWHELAFGLENQGLSNGEIRIRVAEMASFFGIQNWFRKDVESISGGQKQLLNLASIMALRPKILILDEPTSQLDPIAAKNFIDTIIRINKELGTTIIMTEHNLEEVFHGADKVVIMKNGKIIYDDSPRNIAKTFSKNNNHTIFKALPSPTKVYGLLKAKEDGFLNNKCPLTVKEGRSWLFDNFKELSITQLEDTKQDENKEIDKEIAVKMSDVCFTYKRNTDMILRNLSLEVYKGEIYSILGGNGTGKTTTLSVIAKLLKLQRGKVIIDGRELKKYDDKSLYEKIAMLPQNPQSLFLHDTVEEDFEEILELKKVDKSEFSNKIKQICEIFHISHLSKQHPFDLSGGEMQRVALAKIMLKEPKILLLDEATKGLDAYLKEVLGEILLNLKKQGTTIILVSHDIEFSARYSDRCALFFDGAIAMCAKTREFFVSNSFYTTVANRMSKDIFDDVLLYEDVVDLCKMNISK